MLTASVMEKMIACSKGNLHDIDHFLKVWALAKTIGEQEGLESIRSGKVRRWWRAFLRRCLSIPSMWSAFRGSWAITIPIRM